MEPLLAWLERNTPLRGFGNAGAVANAGKVCRDQREAEANADEALGRIAAGRSVAQPARRSA